MYAIIAPKNNCIQRASAVDNDTFVVTAETKITRNGKPAKLSDIQPGDKAKGYGGSRDGMLIAKEIAAVAPQ